MDDIRNILIWDNPILGFFEVPVSSGGPSRELTLSRALLPFPRATHRGSEERWPDPDAGRFGSEEASVLCLEV